MTPAIIWGILGGSMLWPVFVLIWMVNDTRRWERRRRGGTLVAPATSTGANSYEISSS